MADFMRDTASPAVQLDLATLLRKWRGVQRRSCVCRFPGKRPLCRGCSGALGFLDVAYLSLIVGIVDGLDEVRDDFPKFPVAVEQVTDVTMLLKRLSKMGMLFATSGFSHAMASSKTPLAESP